MSDKPAFEVTDLNGKSYRIWANGRTEGFEDMNRRVVINRIPLLISRARTGPEARNWNEQG